MSVYVKAPLDARMKRAQEVYGVAENRCKEVLTKKDKERASYYNYYTSNRWGDAKSYDLCLDSSKYGIHGSVDLIRYAADLKMKRLQQNLEK